MSIPANYKSVMCQIINSPQELVKVIANSSGSDIAQGDFAVIDDIFCGVADLDSASGEDLSLSVTEGMEILTSATAAASTFDAQGDVVYFDVANQEFTDVSAVGLYKVGVLLTPKDSNGLIRFEKFAYVAEKVSA